MSGSDRGINFPKKLKKNCQLRKILNGNAQISDCSSVSGKQLVKIK